MPNEADLKKEAATSLVNTQYPNLMMGMGMKVAVDAWHGAFTQTLTNWGKIMDPNMEEMNKRFQRGDQNRTPNAHLQHSDMLHEQEEVTEQTEMKEVLISEMTKPTKSRNYQVLDELTAYTALSRRQFVISENPQARSLMKGWPSLKIEEIMIKELPRISNDAAGYPEFVARFESIVYSLIDLAREKATRYHSNHPLSSLLKTLPHTKATEPDLDLDLHTVAALVALPYMLPTTTRKATHAHK